MTEEKGLFGEKFFKKGGPYIVIFLIGIFLYFPSLFFDYTFLDDNVLILDHYFFIKDFSNILEAFQKDIFLSPKPVAAYYRPIQTVFLMVGAHFGGKNPLGYHILSVIFHILATYLLFIFLLKLNFKKDLSFFFSILFLVHPVLTSAVVWIPGQVVLLLTIFVLGFFIFLREYFLKGKWYYYLLQLVFFALALFTQEPALVAFFLAFFFIKLILKEKLFSLRCVKLTLGWIGVLALWHSLRSAAIGGKFYILSFREMLKSIFYNFPALFQYLGKVFFPFNLSTLPTIKDTTFLYAILTIILLIVLFFLTKRKNLNLMIFGLIWFGGFLIPSFARPNPHISADFCEHRIYLPLIGLIVFLAELVPFKKINLKKKLWVILTMVLVIFFSILTVIHSHHFKNRISFWENAAKNSPHLPLARRNLGAMYYLEGKLDEAEKQFRAALSLNPFEHMVHNNLGLIYMRRGDFQKAKEELETEIKINPYYETAYYNLGILYYKLGKLKEAKNLWLKTIEINPDYLDPYLSLLEISLKEKNWEEANYWANKLQERGIKINLESLKVLESQK